MRLITEYISLPSSVSRTVKLGYTPVWSVEMGRYALFRDEFKLIYRDGSILPLWGEIKKLNNEYYLTFDNNVDLAEGQYKVAVTYAIDSQFFLSEFFQTAPLPSSQSFVSTSYAPIPLQQGYILQRAEYLATQYRDSYRLKAILLTSLQQLEECSLEGDKIPFAFDLESASGLYLDYIGKIVGVDRRYCGNFYENLAYSLNVYRQNIKNILEIELSDECLRSLIKVKIQKNTLKIVNYKTLAEILSFFLKKTVTLEDYGEFKIGADVGEIDDEMAKCLILLRAFVPLPPTIKLNYIESMIGTRTEDTIVVTSGECIAIGSVKAPNIVIESIEDTIVATSGYVEDSGVLKAPNIMIESIEDIAIALDTEQKATGTIAEE